MGEGAEDISETQIQAEIENIIGKQTIADLKEDNSIIRKVEYLIS